MTDPAATDPARVDLQVPAGTLHIRPVTEQDHCLIQQMHARCSERSLERRCLEPVRLEASDVGGVVPEPLLEWMYDPSLGETLAAFTDRGDIIALTHLVHNESPGHASVGFLVQDDWQGQGLGGRLVDLVTGVARHRGYRQLHAEVAVGNWPMLHVLNRRGWAGTIEHGVHQLTLSLA